MQKWLVLWKGYDRLGSVELTEENLKTFQSEFHMGLIQRDVTGTEHWVLFGVRKKSRRKKS